MNIIDYIVCLLMVLVYDNLTKYLTDLKSDSKIKNVLVILVTTSLIIVNYAYSLNFFKIINTLLILTIFINLSLKVSLNRSVIISFFIELFFVISESIFTFTILFINEKSINYFIDNYFGSIVSNISILIMVIILVRNRFSKKIYRHINKFFEKLNQGMFYILFFVFIFIYNVYAAQFYFGLNTYLLLVLSAIIIFIFLIFLILYFIDKLNYVDMLTKYNGNLNTLKELEKLVDNFRISNHENKNRLLTVRGMTTNKKVHNYIDSIVNVNTSNDNIILKDVSGIPSGGLKGLICSKLIKITNSNIEYDLNVDRQLKVLNLDILSDKTILDICDIVSVYIDNAIEAQDSMKDRYIIIDIYLEDENLIISITNPYTGIISDDIYKKGKSTKGKNRGFGLTLVKKIAKNNHKLSIKYDVTDTEFTQYLYIKIKEN